MSNQMKKLIGWLTVLVLIVVYVVSDSDLMWSIANKRYHLNTMWASDKYRYGDLYGFSYLNRYKYPVNLVEGSGKDTSGARDCGVKRDINLYSICDSYLFSFVRGEKDFCRVNKYAQIRSIDDGVFNVVLDKSKINVLLIESTERQIRNNLGDSAFLGERLSSGGEREMLVPNKPTFDITRFSLNRGINTNLEFNLFDYKFLTPIKEFKAWFNRTVFNRVDGDVSVSSDGARLYYRPTTDTADGSLSSFVTVSQASMDQYINNLNAVAARYKRMGFDQIYFCGIPNPCTVYESGYRKYNGFLPRLQSGSHPAFQFVDIYSPFMIDRGVDRYEKSDTHWNQAGFKSWLEIFNKILDTIPGPVIRHLPIRPPGVSLPKA